MKIIINQILQQTDLSQQECWWLLEHITKKTRTNLITSNYQLTKIEQTQLNELINLIATHHKPLAYILGFVPFLDLELLVQTPILIPRPETESWVAGLIDSIKISNQNKLTILDIGTGSGCIALSLAQALPTAKVYAVDINPAALELAQKNGKKNRIENVIFIKSDLFTHLPHDIKFDLIVSNPPYIDPAVQLEPSVTTWEDHGALFADNHGISVIKKIIDQAKKHLKQNNELTYQLVIEIDVTQSAMTKNLCLQSGFEKIEVRKDQFDRDRTLWAK